ncbi:hypothetical protein NC652_008700 [Populus alba x Populus x berolinensis]|uniref:Uncharacterized protein n=1 Tax=Populus alba x Populus x berolinensis TaxID=444605 RepID=A0AAD6R7F3_9ROSI|nr:hypothetical protein NC652_008700 [Populus alba x Populus x berolinensis]KAJ7003581.1 hypothetical protein NC653_008715 [Populus alba x Populus x berolinensis]
MMAPFQRCMIQIPTLFWITLTTGRF